MRWEICVDESDDLDAPVSQYFFFYETWAEVLAKLATFDGLAHEYSVTRVHDREAAPVVASDEQGSCRQWGHVWDDGSSQPRTRPQPCDSTWACARKCGTRRTISADYRITYDYASGDEVAAAERSVTLDPKSVGIYLASAGWQLVEMDDISQTWQLGDDLLPQAKVRLPTDVGLDDYAIRFDVALERICRINGWSGATRLAFAVHSAVLRASVDDASYHVPSEVARLDAIEDLLQRSYTPEETAIYDAAGGWTEGWAAVTRHRALSIVALFEGDIEALRKDNAELRAALMTVSGRWVSGV